MGAGGKPTPIDFSTQYVIAVIKSATANKTQLSPVSLKTTADGNIEFTYKIETGEKQSFTSKPSLAIIVDKTHDGNVVLVEQ